MAAAFGPFVVLLGQDDADEADDGLAGGEDPHHVGAAPDLLVQALLESLNARYRRAIKARGHFPTDKQAALKCLYLVTRSLDPTGTGQARWTMRWKPTLNAFAITFSDRFPAAETY